MKIRHSIVLITVLFLLTACNFTLAQDVTPPPDYVPPTPIPTMGPLYPANAPDVANGAALYAANCAPCHGATGLGDGPQSAMLQSQNISIPALGSPELAQLKSPAAWFQIVTQGNLENFMPPFSSLSDQERWDVVAYAITLHTTPDKIEMGKTLCGDCAKFFSNQKMMSALSENDLVNLIKNGASDITAFGKDFTDNETLAVAAYIRSLTFATPPAAPTVVPATEASANADSGTPSAEITPPAEGTAQATVAPEATAVAGIGKVSGSIENKTGADLPSDIKVTLHGYEHGGDMTVAPEEVVTLEGNVNADGTYVFENVEMPESRIFLAEVTVNGITYQTDFAIAAAGMTDLSLSPILVHVTTEDFSVLKIESLQIYFDLANADTAQVFDVYSITNTSDKTVVVKMGDQQNIPFISFPAGAEGVGFEATQDSAPFMPIDGGFAMPPSETPYGLIAYSSVPNTKEITISQTALMPIGGVSLLIPEGMEVAGKALTDGGMQTINSMTFHVYTASGLNKNENFEFTLKGKPATTAVNPDITQNKTLLIGVGAFGIVLILAGAWLFMRDRKRKREEEVDEGEEEPDEFEDPESLMDAIIALDDLHRSGKLPDEAYQQRRNELKDALKRKS
jgi:mono/diheme cytochrome c family protein